MEAIKSFFIGHPNVGLIIMSVILVLVVALIKTPIKKFCTNKIVNEKKRKFVNSCFTILLFVLGYAVEFISAYLTKSNINWYAGFIIAGASSGTYGGYELIRNTVIYFADCIKKRKKPNSDEILDIIKGSPQLEENLDNNIIVTAEEPEEMDSETALRNFEDSLK